MRQRRRSFLQTAGLAAGGVLLPWPRLGSVAAQTPAGTTAGAAAGSPLAFVSLTPKDTGITKEYKTAAAFEKKPMDRAAVLAELTKSFEFLKSSLSSTTDAQLGAAMDVFGQKSTARGLWITTATHLHEHLGQLIAYARSNKVTPPWSK